MLFQRHKASVASVRSTFPQLANLFSQQTRCILAALEIPYSEEGILTPSLAGEGGINQGCGSLLSNTKCIILMILARENTQSKLNLFISTQPCIHDNQGEKDRILTLLRSNKTCLKGSLDISKQLLNPLVLAAVLMDFHAFF